MHYMVSFVDNLVKLMLDERVMVRVLFSFAFVLLFNVASLFSQDIGSGTLFLNVPHNVQQYSIGHSASLLGLDGVYTNPASTTLPENTSQYYMESAVNVSQFLSDVFFSNASFLYWFGDTYGTFSATISFLYYGSIPFVDENSVLQGVATAYDLYGSFNYSRKIFFEILIGVSTKIIQQKLHTFNALGFAVDFGVKKKFNIDNNELWISIAGNNFGPAITFDMVGSPLPSKVTGSSSFILRKWLPHWFNVEMGPQFDYFLEKYYNLAWGSKLLFRFYFFEIYGLTRYQYMSSGQNVFSFGGGASYGFSAYQVHASFGMNPFLENNNFITSIKFIYNFGIKKLTQVKPVDFSKELNYNDFQTLPKD